MEGGQLMWILPLYLHVNKTSDDDDDDNDDEVSVYQIYVLLNKISYMTYYISFMVFI